MFTESMMTKAPSIFLGSWIPLILIILAASSSSVMSEETRFDRTIPAPDVTYTTPKISLLQLAWIVPENVQRYEVSATGVPEGHNNDTDQSLQVFTCENDTSDRGICTISGLSADTRYNITVRGCNERGCGNTTILYIHTSSKTSVSHFGTVFAFFLLFVFFFLGVINCDVIVELFQSGYKSLTQIVHPEQTPYLQHQDTPPGTDPQDVILTPVITLTNDEDPDSAPATSPAVSPATSSQSTSSQAVSPSHTPEDGTESVQAAVQSTAMVDLLSPTVAPEQPPQHLPSQHSEPIDQSPSPDQHQSLPSDS